MFASRRQIGPADRVGRNDRWAAWRRLADGAARVRAAWWGLG
jgi:hypothetical protein